MFMVDLLVVFQDEMVRPIPTTTYYDFCLIQSRFAAGQKKVFGTSKKIKTANQSNRDPHAFGLMGMS